MVVPPLIPHSRPWITQADIDAVTVALCGEGVAQGKTASQAEQALGALTGGGAVVTGSGTSALLLCLKALGIAAGDEVILPTYVCHSVLAAIEQTGATPVFCDIGSLWNMTYKTVMARVTSRTRAVVAVHIFGVLWDTAPLKARGLLVIDDLCQAFGAVENGTPVPLRGEASFYSFHATKCLAAGEGGACISADLSLVAKMRQYRDDYSVPTPFSDIQAALLLSQLERYDMMLGKRREIAQRYFSVLPRTLTQAYAATKSNSIFFRFPLRSDRDFERVKADFAARGIAVRRGVDALLHRQAGISDAGFPEAAKVFDETVSIPIYPAMETCEVERVIQATCEVFSA